MKFIHRHTCSFSKPLYVASAPNCPDNPPKLNINLYLSTQPKSDFIARNNYQQQFFSYLNTKFERFKVIYKFQLTISCFNNHPRPRAAILIKGNSTKNRGWTFRGKSWLYQKPSESREGVSQISPEKKNSHASVKLFPIFHPELNQGPSDSTGIPEQGRQILSLKTHIIETLHKFQVLLGWKISLPKHRWAHVQNKAIYCTWEISWTWLQINQFGFYGMKEIKKQEGFKKAQLEKITLELPFHSLALTPFSTRVKGFFDFLIFQGFFIFQASPQRPNNKKLEWGAHSWCCDWSKKWRTKLFQNN